MLVKTRNIAITLQTEIGTIEARVPMEIEIILNLRWNKWLRIHLNAHLHSVIIPSLHEQYVVLLIFITMQLIFIKFWLF